MKDFGKQMTAAGTTLTAGLTVPIVGAAGASLKLAIDFETAFAGVRKTVDATEEEFAALEAGIRGMAKELPATTTEIAAVAEAAGQLGIETENILGFTRVMIDLGETTNLSADQAATALARLANITGLPQDQFDNLGSTIVDLGNNLATTEAEITEFGLRIAGAGKLAGLSEADILSIGAAMSSIGVEAEAGGTAVQKVLNEMTKAVATGGPQLETFAATLNMTGAEFQALFREDPSEAFTQFVENLGTQGDAAFATLEELGLEDQRLIRSFLGLAGAGDLLRTSIGLGNKAWTDNTALTVEAGKRYETSAAQLQVLLNQLKDVGIELGTVLIPVLLTVVEAAKPFIQFVADAAQKFGELPQPIQLVILGIMGFLAILGPLLIGIGLLATGMGALTAVSLPAIAVILAIVAVLALLFLAWKNNWGGIQERTEAVMARIQEVMAAATAFVKGIWDKHGTELKAIWDAVWSVIGTILGFWLDLILTTIEVALAILTGDWEGAWNAMKGFLERTWEAIKSIVGDAADFFINVGKIIIDSLVAGVQNAWNGAKGLIEDIWNGIKKGFTDALQIGSPSRVFTGYGEDIVAGLQQGLAGLEPVTLSLPGRATPKFVTVQIGSIEVPVSEAGPNFDPATAGDILGERISRTVREAFE